MDSFSHVKYWGRSSFRTILLFQNVRAKNGPSFKVHTLASFQKMNIFTVLGIQKWQAAGWRLFILQMSKVILFAWLFLEQKDNMC